MDAVVSYLSGGGIAVAVIAYTVKSFLDKSKEKEARLNKKDVHDALQDAKIDHDREVNKMKFEHIERRLDKIEKE